MIRKNKFNTYTMNNNRTSRRKFVFNAAIISTAAAISPGIL